MKYAADFRRIARNSLRSKWTIAVIAGLVASLLGGIISGSPKLDIENNNGMFRVDFSIAGQEIISTDGIPRFWDAFAGITAYIFLAAIIMSVVFFVLGSIIEIGYSRFNLDLVDRQKNPELGTIFGFFPHWKTTACARLLRGLYVFLWSLLFIIPGIIAGYSYAMTGYILAENPELTAGEAIERSRQMMSGNRWRLFCMQISFIGWEIVSILLTFGIGNLWLIPYKQAANAAFYRDVSGTERIGSQTFTGDSNNTHKDV